MEEHEFKGYRRNFADNTIRPQCSCGWGFEAKDYDEAAGAFKDHLATSTKPKLAVVEALPLANGQDNIIETLEKLIGLIKSGEVRDMVVVYDNRGEKVYSSNGFMDDRWRLLGAIEYAKKYVLTWDD